MIYDLVDCNDPILKTELDRFDFQNPPEDPFEIAANLAETMLENNGLGLSANQCGLPYRVFVMRAEPLPLVFFNPRIVDSSEEEVVLEEGCLSFPGLYIKIKRPRRIKVRYQEPNGNTVTEIYEDLSARVFQHELDHLNGIVHTRRANRYHLEQARKAMKKNKSRGLSSQAINALERIVV